MQPDPVSTGLAQPFPEADAAVAHRMSLDPGVMGTRRHAHDLELRAALQSLGQAVGDEQGTQELVLDIDRALGLIDGIEEERFRLADGFPTLEARLRTGDTDLDIAEVWRHALRPRI